MAFDANHFIPLVVNPKEETAVLNQDHPVLINPTVEGIVRKNKYPIIVVSSVMGSRLFDKKG